MATMEGQVALVTGGARGIGLAISTRLAERGVKVAVGYSHGADTAKPFAAAHEGSTIHQGNIGVAADCERVISEVLEQHGQLDILVNNAGITIDRTVRKMSPEDWDRVVRSTCPAPSTCAGPCSSTCWTAATAGSSTSAR